MSTIGLGPKDCAFLISQEFVNSVLAASASPGERFAAIKVTALADPNLLEKVSRCTNATASNRSSSLLEYLKNATNNLSTSSFLQKQDLEEFEAVVKRVRRVCKAAAENGVKVLIDAEQSWLQPVSCSKSQSLACKVVSRLYKIES